MASIKTIVSSELHVKLLDDVLVIRVVVYFLQYQDVVL